MNDELVSIKLRSLACLLARLLAVLAIIQNTNYINTYLFSELDWTGLDYRLVTTTCYRGVAWRGAVQV